MGNYLKFNIENCIGDFVEAISAIDLVKFPRDFIQHNRNIPQIISDIFKN